MTNRSLLLFALVAGCMQSHSGVQALEQTNCYQCHQKDYEMTPTYALTNSYVPDHLQNQTMYTHQCADCHNTQYWQVHPETAFAVKTGPHAKIMCITCHEAPEIEPADVKGANTLCTSCHPATENLGGAATMVTGHSDQDQTMFNYTTPPSGFTTNNFCLACHPNGREKPHDNAVFPQSHHADTCTDCHDRTRGSDAKGQNAPCTRCHRNAHNQNYMGLGVPTGCVQLGCHYGGQGGDNGG